MTDRRYDLDWLRIIAFGLLILYHCGMFYVTWDWHVKSRAASDAIEPLMMLTSPWRLTLLFVVSGAATGLMIERGRGQVVNVCTWGLHANTFPRFSAYAASKSALAIFGRSLNAERPHPGICATNVYFPLVRTGMIAPTAEYEGAAALSAEEAGRWIVRAVTHQPVEVSPAVLRAVLPTIDYLSPAAADRTIAALT